MNIKASLAPSNPRVEERARYTNPQGKRPFRPPEIRAEKVKEYENALLNLFLNQDGKENKAAE